MLVVRAEIWPGGDESRAYPIGEIIAANESDLAPISSYSVSISQQGPKASGVRKWNRRFMLHGHQRSDGVWGLVSAIIAKAATRGRGRV